MIRSTLLATALLTLPLWAEDRPLTSGLKPGQRPGPYSFLIATGPERGTTTCYVCETGDKPAVVLFVRSLSDPLGKLAGKLDQAVNDARVPELKGWVTLVGDGKNEVTNKLVDFGRQHAIRSMPLGSFEDPIGPASYRLSREADVTALLFVKQKVVANFAFRAGELNDAKADEIVKSLEKLKQDVSK